MRQELERITENMDTVFRGDAWHGPSLMEMVHSLPQKEVNKKHGFSKRTIAQLFYHLLAWRKFIVEKLQDNIHYKLVTEEENWGTSQETGVENWPNLVAQLKEKHAQILEILEEKDDTLLSKRVPGEHYDFYTLLTGLIQHDTYHMGMIWVLWE